MKFFNLPLRIFDMINGEPFSLEPRTYDDPVVSALVWICLFCFVPPLFVTGTLSIIFAIS